MVDNRAADCFYHSLAPDPVAAAFSNTRNVTCLFYRGAMDCPFSCAAFFIVVDYFCFPLSCLSERKNIHREALIPFLVWLLFLFRLLGMVVIGMCFFFLAFFMVSTAILLILRALVQNLIHQSFMSQGYQRQIYSYGPNVE